MFEIHITVLCEDIDKFVSDCSSIGCKPILIDTGVGNQLMTSDRFDGYLWTEELVRILTSLSELGYTIIRSKVERPPRPDLASPVVYFESHIRLKLPLDYDIEELELRLMGYDVHISKNLFKKDTEYKYQMITHRSTEKLSFFKSYVTCITDRLDSLGITYDKIEIEECIYDSDESVDNKWLNS
jgi:hypothetical protein